MRELANNNQILLYETADGETRLEVLYQDESVWLNQCDMAELFQVTRQNKTLHIGNVYDSGELQPDSTCKDFLQVHRSGSHSEIPTGSIRADRGLATIAYSARVHRRYTLVDDD